MSELTGRDVKRRYEMVYRCQYDGLFGDGLDGCPWWTTHYDEIDGHENQLEPGHYVIGQVEDTTTLRRDA